MQNKKIILFDITQVYQMAGENIHVLSINRLNPFQICSCFCLAVVYIVLYGVFETISVYDHIYSKVTAITLRSLVFPCRYHSFSGLHSSFIHLWSTMCNLSSDSIIKYSFVSFSLLHAVTFFV